MAKIYVRKKKTRAIWERLADGVWVKRGLGYAFTRKTKPLGYIAHNFYPLDPKDNRFELVENPCAELWSN